MRILGIETSCDETAIGVVEDGRRVLSNVVASQVELHARYGGIVPEVASRQHLLSILTIYQQALSEAGLKPAEIDALAVTMGPGLAGSLLVGVNFAKGLALAEGLPLVGVNHLEGHVYAAWLEGLPDPAQEPGFPLLALIASGGHTDLVLMRGHGQYTLLGRTRDDAAGEAFDKAARILGLGFPGGPEIQRVASDAPSGESLPRPMLHDGLDFSFSGLKTALLRRFQERSAEFSEGKGEQLTSELAAGFQEAVVEVLVSKALKAAVRFGARGVLLGGGVAANTLLRQEMQRLSSIPVLVPSPRLCVDNGAMIAAAAYFVLERGQPSALDFDVVPNLRLG